MWLSCAMKWTFYRVVFFYRFISDNIMVFLRWTIIARSKGSDTSFRLLLSRGGKLSFYGYIKNLRRNSYWWQIKIVNNCDEIFWDVYVTCNVRVKIKWETIYNALKISEFNGPFVRPITVYKLAIKRSFISCTTFACNKFLDTKEISYKRVAQNEKLLWPWIINKKNLSLSYIFTHTHTHSEFVQDI